MMICSMLPVQLRAVPMCSLRYTLLQAGQAQARLSRAMEVAP